MGKLDVMELTSFPSAESMSSRGGDAQIILGISEGICIFQNMDFLFLVYIFNQRMVVGSINIFRFTSEERTQFFTKDKPLKTV